MDDNADKKSEDMIQTATVHPDSDESTTSDNCSPKRKIEKKESENENSPTKMETEPPVSPEGFKKPEPEANQPPAPNRTLGNYRRKTTFIDNDSFWEDSEDSSSSGDDIPPRSRYMFPLRNYIPSGMQGKMNTKKMKLKGSKAQPQRCVKKTDKKCHSTDTDSDDPPKKTSCPSRTSIFSIKSNCWEKFFNFGICKGKESDVTDEQQPTCSKYLDNEKKETNGHRGRIIGNRRILTAIKGRKFFRHVGRKHLSRNRDLSRHESSENESGIGSVSDESRYWDYVDSNDEIDEKNRNKHKHKPN